MFTNNKKGSQISLFYSTHFGNYIRFIKSLRRVKIRIRICKFLIRKNYGINICAPTSVYLPRSGKSYEEFSSEPSVFAGSNLKCSAVYFGRNCSECSVGYTRLRASLLYLFVFLHFATVLHHK